MKNKRIFAGWQVWVTSFVVTMGLGFQAFATGPELTRLLDSVAGRFILTRTERGAEIVLRSLGHELSARQGLRPLIARLTEGEMSQVADELETGLTLIERQFARRYPDQQAFSVRGVRLTAAQEQFLEALVLRNLKVDIRFYPASARETYDASRRAFENALNANSTRPTKRFPLGVDPQTNPDAYLQFGFESEYALSESGKLLRAYGPERRFGIGKRQWLAMSDEERVQWVKDHLDDLFPYEREDGGLVRITNDPELSFLPERLIKDSTGNLEIILKPVNTLETWKKTVTSLNEKLGYGSMQGTVSVPTEAFFGLRGGQSVDQAVEENLGYFTFMSDFDVLVKLELGAARYARDPSKEVAKSFNHPFLGPLTRKKQILLEDFLRGNASGEMFDGPTRASVSKSDASFKYIGSTAYRPDIVGPRRIVQEVRDAHTNLPALMDRVLRTTYYTQYGRQIFREASRIRAFDSVGTFNRLPENVRETLIKVFPEKAVPGVVYNADEKIAIQVYRNFAYPMRDWTAQLRFLGETKIASQVNRAQQEYLRTLRAVSRDLAANRITKVEASRKIQGAVAKFSTDSGLVQAYRRWQSEILLQDPRWKEFVLWFSPLSGQERAFA